MVRKLIPDIVSGQDIFKLDGAASVRDAAVGMAARDVNSVLITKDGDLIGIFTGTDLVRKVVAEGLDPEKTPLLDVMTSNPQTVGPDMNAIEALHCMQNGHFRHLPIVEDGQLLGVLSRRDFLGYEIEELEHQEHLWETI
jgi:CBS domain-containing protein